MPDAKTANAVDHRLLNTGLLTSNNGPTAPALDEVALAAAALVELAVELSEVVVELLPLPELAGAASPSASDPAS